MASPPNPIPPLSTAIVRYDPNLPHVSAAACQEAAKDKALRHSLEVAKFESRHLSLENRLVYLAQHLPGMMPFPFSGVIALQAGNGAIVQDCHCPNQPAFTIDQPFNALSVGKLFTATAAMQLIEDEIQVEGEKISLNTPLSKLLTPDELDLPLKTPYLEQKPDASSLEELKKHMGEITLGQLLAHKAGFVDRPEDNSQGINGGNNWDQKTIGDYSYSNYGYQLLARIIGKHSNRRNPLLLDHEAGFRAHIEERIFIPSGMEGAILEIHSPTKNKPDCFEVPTDGTAPEKIVEPEPYPHGNGCWRMTASDLLLFGQAIHQHHLLIKESSFQTMKEQELGFMVNRNKETGRIIGYGHPGGGPGMSSFLHTWCQNPPITAAVLSNYSGCSMVKPELDKFMQP